MKNEKVLKMVLTGVFAALSYAVFTFLQIKIPLPGGTAVSIHLGNAVCVLAALLLGGPAGGLAGAIGMTVGDLFDPVYVLTAPKTFVLKFCIGMITGLIAHKLGHITWISDKKRILRWVTLASIGGLGFNMVFDPLVGYYYKLLVLGKPAAEVALTWDIGITALNAAVSTVVCVALYMALLPALKKTGIFFRIGKSPDKKG